MNTIEFMHYRSANGSSGGATVAIKPDPSTNTALISVARCGPHDIFNKKVGRAVSAGRINAYMAGRVTMADVVTTIDIPEGMGLKESVDAQLFDEMSSYGLS